MTHRRNRKRVRSRRPGHLRRCQSTMQLEAATERHPHVTTLHLGAPSRVTPATQDGKAVEPRTPILGVRSAPRAELTEGSELRPSVSRAQRG